MRWLPPIVMVRGIVVSLLIVVAMTLVATSFAQPESHRAQLYTIGTFGDDDAEYDYDANTLTSEDNIRTVWITTHSTLFNYSNDAAYMGASGKYQLDCSGHSYKFLEGVTYRSSGEIIAHGKNPADAARFITIQEHTPQYGLWRILCAEQPII